jgi:hypothetical protein
MLAPSLLFADDARLVSLSRFDQANASANVTRATSVRTAKCKLLALGGLVDQFCSHGQ